MTRAAPDAPPLGPRPLRIVVAATNRRWADANEPFRHVETGLRRLGHDVEVVAPLSWPLTSRRPDAVFLWNGAKGIGARLAERFRRDGVKTMIMERGFFDRFNYTQIDHQGFNHNASWASELRQRAWPGAAARLKAVWGKVTPIRRRTRGYILVLLQVAADSQLGESEISHPGQLVRAMEAAVPTDIGIEIRLREHPLGRWNRNAPGLATMIGGALQQAVAGARFCVTINSGAANEALAWGCPVLCLGPALYAMAGAAMQTSLADLAEKIAWMLNGGPPQEPQFNAARVRNYLSHLACRQWNRAELAEGAILQRLLDEA